MCLNNFLHLRWWNTLLDNKEKQKTVNRKKKHYTSSLNHYTSSLNPHLCESSKSTLTTHKEDILLKSFKYSSILKYHISVFCFHYTSSMNPRLCESSKSTLTAHKDILLKSFKYFSILKYHIVYFALSTFIKSGGFHFKQMKQCFQMTSITWSANTFFRSTLQPLRVTVQQAVFWFTKRFDRKGLIWANTERRANHSVKSFMLA